MSTTTTTPLSNTTDLFSAGEPVGHPRGRRIAAGALGVLLIVIGVVAWQRHGSHPAMYRTATVERQNVSSYLDGVATVNPVSQASVAFPISGTVTAVNVKPGDQVTAGQSLASIDDTSLASALDSAKAKAAQAALDLQRAMDGESTSNATGSASGFSTTGAASDSQDTTPVVLPVGFTTKSSNLDQLQQQVLDAQKKVDSLLRSATAALANAQLICKAGGTDRDTTSPDEVTPSTSTTVPAPTSTSTSCGDALNTALDAQQSLARAQSALAVTAAAFDRAVTNSASTSQSGSSSSESNSAQLGTSPQSRSGSGATQTSRGAASSTSSVSAATLIAKQAAVDSADAAVAAASDAIAQATIHSPIAGKVIAVDLQVGDTTSQASASERVLIVGSDSMEATMITSVDDLRKVEVGQQVSIVPDGSSSARSGTVTSIGLDSSTSSDGTTSYPITIGFSGSVHELGNGSTASVAIRIAQRVGGLAVPTSAVTTNGTRHTVTVLSGATAKQVSVEIGPIGSEWTTVTRGLTEGQKVVLADLSEALPGSATATSTNATNGANSTRRFGDTGNGGPDFGGGAGGFVFRGGGGG